MTPVLTPIPTPVRSLALAAALTPCLAAQTPSTGVQIRGETTSTISVYAEQTPTQTDSRTLPLGTKFTSGIQVRAAAGSSFGMFDAWMSKGVATAVVSGEATWLRGSTNTVRAGATGPQRVRFHLSSPQPMDGRIVVRMSPIAYATWSSFAFASTVVQVAGSTFETRSTWALPVTKSAAVHMDAAGHDVDVALSAYGTSNGTTNRFELKVEVWFEAGHGVTNYGKSCVHLTGRVPAPDTIELYISSSTHVAETFLLLGHQRKDVVIDPIYGCRLLLEPFTMVALPGRTDTWGRLTVQLPLPDADFTLKAQVVVPDLGWTKVELTDALDLTIRKR